MSYISRTGGNITLTDYGNGSYQFFGQNQTGKKTTSYYILYKQLVNNTNINVGWSWSSEQDNTESDNIFYYLGPTLSVITGINRYNLIDGNGTPPAGWSNIPGFVFNVTGDPQSGTLQLTGTAGYYFAILYNADLLPSTVNFTNMPEYNIVCMLKGTSIIIQKNNIEMEENIENLNVGDLVKILVPTSKSNDKSDKKSIIYKPIKNIGYGLLNLYNLNKLKGIRKDAFSYNIPNKDLYLTNGHSLCFSKDVDYNIYKNDEYTSELYDKHNIKMDDFNMLLMIHCNKTFMPELKDLSSIINKDNTLTYYHITLESEDEHKQYVVYTNNCTSETMSIFFYNNFSFLKDK